MLSLLFATAVTGTIKCHGEQDDFRVCRPAECESEVCIDCIWSDWSDYTPCTCEGLKERHRTVKRKNNECGKPCAGAKVETGSCQPDCVEKPVDCQLGDWSDWSNCDKTCEGGQRYRVRHISHNLRNNGRGCEANLKETEPCNVHKCFHADTCVLSEWSRWSTCSATCDVGQEERHRHIQVPSEHGGKPCDASLSEIRPCELASCEQTIPCKWGEWGNWSACSQTCGGGDRSRSRLIEVAPRNGGKLCEALPMSEVDECNSEPCSTPKDCVFGPWTDWDACSCSCNGIQHRVRHIQTYPEDIGKPCVGPLREVQACNHETCDVEANGKRPIDCELSPWAQWTHCSATCNGGSKKRLRSIMEKPLNNGRPCSGELEIVAGCGEDPCPDTSKDNSPLDCVWSPWDDWGACSASCGGGEKIRQRQITSMANKLGKPCESQASMEVVACNTVKCGCQECKWGEWSEWGACTCTGLQERHRAVDSRYHACGSPCEGPKVTTKSCHPDCLGKTSDCALSTWSAWTVCTVQCGGGQKERSRQITTQAENGGKSCDGILKDITPCNTESCHHAQDCVISSWENWSTCTKTCGGGQSYRTRSITTAPNFGGQGCTAKLHEVRGCNNESCEGLVDCKWGEWSEWSACSADCDGGQKARDRQVKVAPRNGGKLCAPLVRSELVPCNLQHCNEHCRNARWSAWTEWSLCTATCGDSYQYKSRTLVASASECGKAAEGLAQEFRKCDFVHCSSDVVDCGFSEWTEWGSCTCTCNGVRERMRHITLFPQKGGKECDGALKEVKPCNYENCLKGERKDCVLSNWSDWGQCSSKCDGGVNVRSRHIEQQAEFEGAPCEGYLKEVGSCGTDPCPGMIDCKWGEWNDWGACSVDCDGGQRNRYRHIITMSAGGGKECEANASAEVEECNVQACGRVSFCEWGIWNSWSECSVTCGDGQQKRSRFLKVTHHRPEEGSIEDVLIDNVGLRSNFTKSEQLGIIFLTGMLLSALVTFMLTTGRRTTFARLGLIAVSNPVE